MRTPRLLLIVAALLPLAPAVAQGGARRAVEAPAPVLGNAQRDNYRAIFAAIRSGDWAGAAARLDAMRDGPLHAAARAELYLAKGSPRVELAQLVPLISAAPEAPQAEQLRRLAETRGGTDLPAVHATQRLVWTGEQPRRARAKGVTGDPIADDLEPRIQQLIVDDQPAAAEALLAGSEFALSPAARTEFQQRVAWSHYLVGSNEAARALALKAARGGSGEWALHAEWVAGLAAWRMRDCNEAARSFAAVASRSSDVELSAAGHYWAARADMMCQRPESVQARLRGAALHKETFYGLLAASALGIKTGNHSGLHDYDDAEWRSIAARPNVRAALALAEIGELSLADDHIRHQARIGPAAEHGALIHLAAELDLASTQFWLAHNAPRGAAVNIAARYPMPDWTPSRGWRVDPALLFAHALQESGFRHEAVSPAGAHGIMQVRPGTAGDIARERGVAFDRQMLFDPEINIEYGQSFLEHLRDFPGVDGLLLKVIASYNAGPSPIREWNGRQFDGGDPLLYIESIPYWETRGYVPIVLRNYWIYEQLAGKASTSRSALAQGLWPRFPGQAGPSAVRIERPGTTRLPVGYRTN